MIRKFFVFAIALAAAVAVGEAFAQGPAPAPAMAPGAQNSLLNRNLRNRPGGNRPNMANRPRMANRPGPMARQPGAAQGGAAAAGKDAGAPATEHKVVSIEFNAAPVDLVFVTLGNLINKTILKDPALPTGATITLKPKEDQELTDEEKIFAITTVLEMNGIHIEPYGDTDKFVRAIPRAKIRTEGIPLILDPEQLDGVHESTHMVSFMIYFKNISYEEAQKVFEGLKSKDALLTAFERTNSILVTDTGMNIKRMLEIVAKIDVSTPVTDQVFNRQIKYASAAEIKTVLEAIVQDSKQEQEKANGGKQVQNRPQPQPFRPGLLNRNNPQNQNNAGNQTLVNSMSDADRGMIRGKVLIISEERSNQLIIITSKANMDFFDRVIEQLDVETTPDTVVKVYRLKYAEADKVSDMINDLIGNAPSSKSSGKSNQNQNAKKGSSGNMSRTTPQPQKKSVNQRSGEAKAGELSKENTTVLADERINGLVVMTSKELVPVVESIIEAMDVKLSQVLIETCIIEVQLGNGIKTGIDWVQNGRYQEDGTLSTRYITDSYGRGTYKYTDGNGHVKNMICDDLGIGDIGTTEDSGMTYKDGDTTWTRIGDALSDSVWTSGEVTKNGLVTGNAGYAQMLGGGSGNGAQAAAVVQGAATNLFGSALNYVFKSDKLNLSAIIQATKTDNRTKYIASPIVMTVDNKEATIEATTARKFLSNYQTSSSYYGSTPAPQYENKDIGIKIKVTPKINPNGTVMLEIEEEYSQVGAQQSILDPNSNPVSIDTALTRKMSADALLENGQTVVLCGMTETQIIDSYTGIPILMDIPWIGKWLFSKVSQEENRAELLIFMTPYVLADGDDAEAEALRRKQALSDPNAWDDHGWSKSKLADPVRAKELLRRQKLQWKNVDEDHDSQIELDKAKKARVLELRERALQDENDRKEFDKQLKEKEEEIEKAEKEAEVESEEESKSEGESKSAKESKSAEESKSAKGDGKAKSRLEIDGEQLKVVGGDQ